MGNRRCPKCGRTFTENLGSQSTRYALGTAEVVGKGVVHVGARLLGGALGAFGGSMGSKAGSRAGGMLANELVGDLETTKSSQLKCPYCGHRW